MIQHIKIYLFRLAFGLMIFSATVISGQQQNQNLLLETPEQDLDICRSTVYILQNNLPKSTSKKISKKLSKELRRVKKGLKVKKRYYNTDCRFIDLTLIHISEPPRQAESSYAVVCL